MTTTKARSGGGGGGGLTTFKRSQFLALNPSGEIAEAMKANLDATGEHLDPSDLVRVPTPTGGGTTWQIPNAVTGGDDQAQSITGVLVFYQRCGVLWPSDEPEEGAMPVLRSMDLETAQQIGPIPDDMIDTLEKFKISEGVYNWKDLPYNQFGSGKAGVGKRCKEQRMMFLLRETDAFPLLVTAQPGSLKTVTRFFKMLPSVAPVPYWHCIVELTLQKVKSRSGQAYSQIVPRLVGTLPKEDGEFVKRQWTDQLSRIADRIDEASPGEDADE